MLKPIKINAHDSDVFAISDLHYRHNREFIFGPRGFKTVTEHDETLVKRWNEVCNDKSIVFHLGDIIFADPDGSHLKELLRKLSFDTLFLMWGNHVSGQKALYLETLLKHFPDAKDKEYEVYPLSMQLDGGNKQVVFLPQYVEVSTWTANYVLCHYPIISHNGLSKGSIHLTGHTHSNLDLTHKDKGRGFRLDVGVESFGRPVSFAEIKKHLAGRDYDSQDHHGAE